MPFTFWVVIASVKKHAAVLWNSRTLVRKLKHYFVGVCGESLKLAEDFG